MHNKIGNKNFIKNIKDLKDFKISGFDIPLINTSFIDLADFYQINNYNVQKHLQQYFSIYILKYFKKIIVHLLLMKPAILDNFYKYLLNLIKSLVKNLLEEKIFTKYNRSTFEDVINAELTEEERNEFKNLIKEATEQAGKLLNKK